MKYRLEAISDFYGTGSKKTWFHFRVAAPGGLRIRFSIENINIYDNMYGVCIVLLRNWSGLNQS